MVSLDFLKLSKTWPILDKQDTIVQIEHFILLTFSQVMVNFFNKRRKSISTLVVFTNSEIKRFLFTFDLELDKYVYTVDSFPSSALE